MKISFPGVDARAIAMGFTFRRIARIVRAEVEKLGPDNIRWLIENNKPLSSRPEVKAREAELRIKALKYRPLAAKISDEAFLHMLPAWSLQIVQDHGEQGQQWLRETLEYLRGFFKEG